ncbi:tRNA-splicing endonuclease subunit Sen54 isoform X2 [Rhinatrema bivittatum]|uniref:tRNA-splicing endonuclease subunit Sen54 isoform X2 n=1 Tax=Rhinatrema bivittatum TaxID=194408 RepID=UPI00112AAE6A|nr:tRNA-splicing endonuclease subunit Sen54 isoform X2 [Rhinatrema bivittatum]
MDPSAGVGGSRALSPAELFNARTRNRCLPQRSHGPKDFLPDNSEEQREKLRLCQEEEWQLLSEERVERLGNLVKAEWKPQEDLVELQSPAGKFWHTMGFSEQGKQCLFPEEAVYLLECGSVQLFYKGLPLSIQEAYERLLSQGTVTLLQYQVFSHLKRLGYIVMRFNPCTVLSPYERQLNLESCYQSSGRSHRKRKRSSTSRFKNKEENESKRNPAEGISGGVLDSHGDDSQLTSELNRDWTEKEYKKQWPDNGEEQTHNLSCAKQSHEASDQSQSRTEDHVMDSLHTSPQGSYIMGRSRWDFTKIKFPDCASDCPQTLCPQPYKGFLPENIAGQKVDVSRWRRRLNQKREKLSRREEEQLEREYRYKRSVNMDRAVRQCCSWQEYKELLKQRGERLPQLWNDVVSPLVQLEQVGSSASLLDQISVLQSSHMLDGITCPQENAQGMKIDFDVYQADAVADFKKSSPGKPYARMCVRRVHLVQSAKMATMYPN